MADSPTLWSQLRRLFRLVEEVGAGEPDEFDQCSMCDADCPIDFTWRSADGERGWCIRIGYEDCEVLRLDSQDRIIRVKACNPSDSDPDIRSALRWVMGVEPCPECGGEVVPTQVASRCRGGDFADPAWIMACTKCSSWQSGSMYATKTEAVRAYVEERKGGTDG